MSAKVHTVHIPRSDAVADGDNTGDVELANVCSPGVATEEKDVKEEVGESKDAGKKTFDIFSYLGFNFDETIEEGYSVPKKSYLELFIIFLWFGCRAFGGPGKNRLQFSRYHA